jgi:DNA-binding CsgD family transcriptional regulator
MIGIDDLHWADPGSVAAVAALPGRLVNLPIAWLVTLRPNPRTADLERLVSAVEDGEGEYMTLPALDASAITQIAGDVLGGDPSPDLLALAESSRGSPFLLVELLAGLLEEDSVRNEAGVVELIDARLPARVTETMRARLARLSRDGRRTASTAAVLGASFEFDHLVAMLDVPAADLLEPVEELIRADLFIEDGERLSFRHDLIREAVLETLPSGAHRALQRQAADVLLSLGAPPVEVAAQLATSADFGDLVAVASLRRAASQLSGSAPSAAADLSARALELTPREEPTYAELVAETAVLLHAAGRVAEGSEFANEALHAVLPVEQEAAVRLSIAGMYSLSPDIRAETGRAALGLHGLSPSLRAGHEARLIHNLFFAGRADAARNRFEANAADVRATEDAAARLVLDMCEAGITYSAGDYGAALDQVEAGLRRGAWPADQTHPRLAQQWRAELLFTLDQSDRAVAVLNDALGSARRAEQAWAVHCLDMWRGRHLMHTGALGDAQATLLGALESGMARPTHNVVDAAGLVALGRVAIHLGDASESDRLSGQAQEMVAPGNPPDIRRQGAWLLALQAAAKGEERLALVHLHDLGPDAEESVLPIVPSEAADLAALVRIALGGGDTKIAERAVGDAERRAKLNPQGASVTAAAAHARGLFDRDRDAVLAAASLLDGKARPLSQASALEDAGRLSERGDEQQVDLFSRALEIYHNAGASWDAGRLRGRLRDLGINRRVVSARRPASGWEALTDSELVVVRLVARGSTNRQAADQLFLSPHTVSMHLRHAFAKLEINSRVELAAIVHERDRPKQAEVPSS